jgi:Xaa-Pro aminopeptidase
MVKSDSQTEESIMGIHEIRQYYCRKIMAPSGLDGLLFTSLENIRYHCGFTGSDGAFVLGLKESFFLTDSRYWTQSEEEVKEAKIVRYRKKTDGILALFSDLGLKRIGFESNFLPFSLYRFLREKLSSEIELIPLDSEIKNLRAVKDDEELASIRKAIDIASNAFEHILKMAKEGVLERDLAFEMEFFMKREGAEDLGFNIIIASGERSALPHGRASDKKIKKGDLLLIDFGSRFQGYHSDQTRTVVCGMPSTEQKKIYQIVKDAQERAIDKVRPGIPFQEVDLAARDYIRQCGYDEYFGHGTGHGIGLAVHEDPAVNRENNDLIQEGMVFTVEPGIYLPNRGGVRIEDMVKATATGVEVLTYLPKELREI